jgi:hypothetical protein
MYKPSNRERLLDWLLDSPAVTALVLVVLLALPVAASSGVTGIESRDGPPSGAYQKDSAVAYNYQMRCWQHGRLLFEQNLLELPTGGNRYPLKVSGSDRHGHPVYVAETSNATCLIRSVLDTGAPRR